MQYGHEAVELMGLTLQPSAMSRWALSLHVTNQLRLNLTAMKDGRQSKITTTHKEESMSRIKSDAADMEKLRVTLCSFIEQKQTGMCPGSMRRSG